MAAGNFKEVEESRTLQLAYTKEKLDGRNITFAPIYRGTYLPDILSINSQLGLLSLLPFVLNRPKPCRHRRAVLTGVDKRTERGRRVEAGEKERERERGRKKR